MSKNIAIGNKIAKNLKRELNFESIEFRTSGRDSEYIFKTNKGKFKYVNTGYPTLYIFNEFTNKYEIYDCNINLSFDNLIKD